MFFSSFVGTALLALVLYKSTHLFEGDFFLRVSPLLSLVGWALVASGMKGLGQYRREMLLLGFLAVPWEFVYLFDVSLVTAKFSAFVLWLLGFEVTRQGVWLILPAGSIEVYRGCSGIRTIFQLLSASWLVLAIAPTTRVQKIGLPIAAILLGFAVNGGAGGADGSAGGRVRYRWIYLLARGDGSLIFSAIAMLAFGCVCAGTIARKRRNTLPNDRNAGEI